MYIIYNVTKNIKSVTYLPITEDTRDNMKKFNELLKEYINTQNLTIYQISKQTGINRTMLQNVLSGSKKFPKKRLLSMLDSAYFTSEQIKNLSTAYFCEEHGEDKSEFFEFCNYCFSQKFCDDLNNTYSAKQFASNGEVEFLSDKEKIIAAVNMLIENGENDTFVSNFNFGQKEINTIIYNACKNKKFKEFYHYTNYSDNEKENINIIFNSIYYASQGYLTYITSSVKFDLIFSKFVMCGDTVVLFDDEMSKGLVIKNKELVQYILNKNEKIKSTAKSDVYIFHNAFEFMHYLDILSHKRKAPDIYSVDNHLCCSLAFTKEMIDDIATEQIKNSEQVYSQLVAHYNLLLDETDANVKLQILSYNGVAAFVKTGRFLDFPKAFATTLNPKHRAEILSYYLNNDFLLTNPELSKFDKLPINFEICQSQVLFSYNNDYTNDEFDNGIQIIVESDDTNIIRSLKSYFEYLTISEKTYSAEYSKKLIKAQIDILNAM